MQGILGDMIRLPGEKHPRMYAVLSGSIEVLRPGTEAELLIVVHHAGQFIEGTRFRLWSGSSYPSPCGLFRFGHGGGYFRCNVESSCPTEATG